ncbi:MAG: hypothetical protein ABIJ12_02510 [bacterium]
MKSRISKFFSKALSIKSAVVLFSLLFIFILKAGAAVMVAPTVVFLSDQKRTDRIIVQNPSDKPAEVTIRFSFGLPLTDSLGNVKVELQDSLITDPKSATDWIQAFPRKVLVPALGSQTIRLVARPPQDLSDGEYWTRIVVSSKEGEQAAPANENPDGISTQLNLIMQMAIMVKYRTGELVSELELIDAKASSNNDQIEVLLDLNNKGNVSYMGILEGRLVDADGKEISTNKVNLAVYRDMRRRLDFIRPGEEFKSPYKVELFITPDGRNDVPPEDMVKGNKISYSVVVE